MRKTALAALIAAGCMRGAQAAVLYGVSTPGATFTEQVPSFLTADTAVDASALASVSGGVESVSFLPSCPDAGGGYDEIKVTRSGEVDFVYVSEGAFGADGVYATSTSSSAGR